MPKDMVDPEEHRLVLKALTCGLSNDLYRFYYKVIIALPEFRRGLFVEMRLVAEDPEFPCVEFVNAHPQVP